VSGTGYIFANGTQVATGSLSTKNYLTSVSGLAVVGGNFGNNPAGSAYFPGYISGLVVVKGSGVTSVTVPTAPPSPTGTNLCLNYTNGGIIDTSMSNDLETVGNAQISTTQSKFGGGSISLDGTGDYLMMRDSQNFVFGTGDFTIEFWVYYNSGLNADVVLYDARPTSTNGVYNILYSNSTGKIVYSTNSADRITGTTTMSTGTWYHIALARSGTSTKLFLNGTQEGSTYTDSNSYLLGTNRPVIGTSGFTLGNGPLNGYIDDLRITKGYARYTANFTAPVGPFVGFGD
jgi:hypothetical protein